MIYCSNCKHFAICYKANRAIVLRFGGKKVGYYIADNIADEES